MPIRALRVAPPPDDELVPLVELPEVARLLAYSGALTAARDQRQRELDIAEIETALKSSPNRPRAALLRERLARLRAAQPAPKAELPAAGWPLPTSAASKLLAGEALPPQLGREARLAKLREEVAALDAEIGATEMRMEQAKADASREVSMRLQKQHEAILVSIYKSAVALTIAVATERRLLADLIVAGYDPRPDILIRSHLDGANRLGALDQYDSQISQFCRRLEAQGVL